MFVGPLGGGHAVFDHGRHLVLGAQAVVDGDDDAWCVVRDGATDRVFSIQIAGDEAAAMSIDTQGQVFEFVTAGDGCVDSDGDRASSGVAFSAYC